MIIQLNPFKIFQRRAAGAIATEVAEPVSTLAPQESKTAKAEESDMAGKFVSVMEAIGKGFAKGLSFAVQYAVPVEKLVGLLFPAAAPVTNEVADATSLIQTSVLLVEQKYAASGVQTGTGQQKLAEVMLLAGQAVTSLLSKAGIAADASYVANLVSAVVAILNVQSASASAVA